VLVAAVIIVGAFLALAAITFGGFSTAQRKLSGAADLVALSGATEYAAARDPCQEAGTIAQENSVTLADCSVVGDALDFVVTVTVTTSVGWPGFSYTLEATAHAGQLSG